MKPRGIMRAGLYGASLYAAGLYSGVGAGVVVTPRVTIVVPMMLRRICEWSPRAMASAAVVPMALWSSWSCALALPTTITLPELPAGGEDTL